MGRLRRSATLTWKDVRGQRFVDARCFDQQPVDEFLHDLRTDPDQLQNLATDSCPVHRCRLASLSRSRWNRYRPGPGGSDNVVRIGECPLEDGTARVR
jgi:hypothetical protein